MKPAEMVKCLHACAGFNSECKRCLKTVGYGCSRDLKMEAAAMIQEMAAKLENIVIENAGKDESFRRETDGKS